MFSTFEDFFNNYRIKNGMAPNETTLNVGLLRLKREVRELKSILDVVISNPIEPWNKDKIYETDEYVSYNDQIYRSKSDTNISMNPQLSDDFWELIVIPSIKINPDTSFYYQELISTENQTVFDFKFDIVGDPCIFIDGELVDRGKYTYTDKQLTFNEPLQEGKKVVVIHGVAYEPGLILPSEELTAKEGQFDFTVDFDLISPNVFMNGNLLSAKDFTYGKNYISLEEPAVAGDILVITNGASVGMKDFYTKKETDALLDGYYTKDEVYTKSEVQTEIDKLEDSIYDDTNIVKANTVYTKTEVDNLLKPKATTEYVDTELDKKANWSDTLDGYGITNAYVKHEVDALLLDKLDVSEFTGRKIISLINGAQEDVPINASSVNGYTADDFYHVRDFQDVSKGFAIWANSEVDGVEISFDEDGSSKLPVTAVYKDDDQYYSYTGRIFNELNSKDAILNVEGDFQGTFFVNLYNLGILNPQDYNWNVIVQPTTIPRLLKHDFIPKGYGSGFQYKGFYENTQVQASHFYGFVEGNILKCYAYAEVSNTNMRKWYAHYKLTGILKTLSTNIYYNQGQDTIDFIRYPFLDKPTYNDKVQEITDDMKVTPSISDILQDNQLNYTNTAVTESASTNTYQSQEKHIFTPRMVVNIKQINNNGEACIFITDALPNSDFLPVISGDGEFTTITYNFNDYGEAELVVRGKSPFTTAVQVSITGSMIEPCSVTIPIVPTV